MLLARRGRITYSPSLDTLCGGLTIVWLNKYGTHNWHTVSTGLGYADCLGAMAGWMGVGLNGCVTGNWEYAETTPATAEWSVER
ncbi:hypothetical protein B0T26DRAFT_688992 [Lasiosphaeria miniovina]|uniref:Uncharacterized protein n=1 Tax=Lasiosphaeria miniovina TaxID=1954250 RepID=A0AA40EEJ7_9PEZI|nr:uncharacterized protein B0T26DRAFT_688992 [Lasiosphaeria miniovina]KAK0734586.1 hypothetical protein B0T26DRAFT_688992 [Lasiosphaeria miniovina]